VAALAKAAPWCAMVADGTRMLPKKSARILAQALQFQRFSFRTLSSQPATSVRF
jgi:hypothetical protein